MSLCRADRRSKDSTACLKDVLSKINFESKQEFYQFMKDEGENFQVHVWFNPLLLKYIYIVF
jgi:hypothetical protein